jgi:hypothetical protein
MRKQWVEHRSLHDNTVLSWDIAQHFFTRYQFPAVVVTNTPATLYPAVRKQWQKIIRQIQRERSSTLNASKIYELTSHVSRMQSLRMGAKTLANSSYAEFDLWFATVDALRVAPPVCHTLYVTVDVAPKVVEIITRRMPAGSLVVRY